MILKEYQKRTVAKVRSFVAELAKWRTEDQEARRHNPNWGSDWVQRAWDRTVAGRRYHPRRNGLGEHLPAFCLNIPTGGGKTLLATRVIDLVNAHFRQSRRGLVLWSVPTTQIYNQTLKALKDRDHPYRQQLDLSSGQRTRIFEKTTAFGPRDVAENLCVLLLMLPSANRKTKDTLRMFRDSGGFDRFFPPDDDPTAHAKMLEEHPNLDTFEQTAGFWGRYIKTSLGNTVRLLRPLIILDEGHKAYSANAKATLEGFNPCMIVELSATPAKSANVLVEILGRELNAEEMIKLDLHILNKAGGDWRGTLLESVEHREALEAEARLHEAESGTYIRPICVIQVERTGRQQRKPGYVHTDDVREYLLQHPGIAPEHIAVKTSSKDELKEADDVGGLLSRDCHIRFIITKQALQEGWDCPFAYVLTILTNPMSKTGITQLVGRILRQPYASKTGVALLDESYVFCFSRRGNELLKEVRKGFGLEGLQGLEGRVVSDDGPFRPPEKLTTRQRARYRTAARDLVLPAFMIRDLDGWRLVRYEADILARVRWGDIDLSALDDLTLGERGDGDAVLVTNVVGDASVSGHEVAGSGDAEIAETPGDADSGNGGDPVDYFFAASHLLDLVPNPWQGRDLARRTFEALLERYPAERVAANHVFVLEELRRRIEIERDRLSREVFHALVTLRDDQAGADDGFRRVFVVETKGVHLKESEDTEYKRSVFDICGEHARKTDWAELAPAMRSKVVRFEVVDEDEWQARLNGMLFRRTA